MANADLVIPPGETYILLNVKIRNEMGPNGENL